MTLWEGSEFVEATGGRALGDAPSRITGISIDTRTLADGEAFFAIVGDRFDGHDFASHAMRAGAGCIVVGEDRAIALGHLNVPKVVVPDVLAALEHVGRAARARTSARIAAITGSVGKTTTKEMLRAALTGSGETHAAVASFNNHWGVPLTLSRMSTDTAFGVFEIGMNHAGEITPLVGMVRPHVAAITRIAPAHLGNFSSIEEIATAKAEIFSGLVEGGTAVLNADDEYFAFLEREARNQGVGTVRTFGTGPDCDVLVRFDPALSFTVEGTHHEVDVPLRGRHNAMNAACAVAVAVALGAGAGAAIRGISTMSAVSGRGTVEQLPIGDGQLTLVDESYNANPVSMAAALDVLATMPLEPNGRRIVILGDMRELGRFSQDLHADLDSVVLATKPHAVVLVGDEIGTLAERLDGKVELYHRSNVEAAEPVVRALLRPNDVVMLKASNGTGLGRLATALRRQENDAR